MDEIETFLQNADFIWNSILQPGARDNSDQDRFMSSLSDAISYLDKLKLEDIKFLCSQYDVADKISMIIDLKDYVYKSLKDEWENTLF